MTRRCVGPRCSTLTGRLAADTGRARVCGELLPEQSGAVRRHTAFISAVDHSHLGHEIDAALARQPRLVVIDDADTVADDAGQRPRSAELVHSRSQRGPTSRSSSARAMPRLFAHIDPRELIVISPPAAGPAPMAELEGALA